MKTKIVFNRAVGLAAGVSHLQRLAVLMTALLAAHPAPAATVIWSGGGTNQNWSLGGAGGNWGGSPAPGPADDVKFFDLGGTNQGNVNNIVDASRTVRSLQYANSNNFHTTLIAAGQTLTITNGLTAGTGTSNGADFQITATVTGAGGTLALTGGNLSVGQPAENTGSHRAGLDLSGLDTFNASCGRILVGVGDSSFRRVVGRLTLAVTNTISLSGPDVQLMVGDNPGATAGNNNNNISYILLGATNTINVNTIRVGGARQQGSMSFGDWTHASLVLRGANGTGRVGTIAIGDNQASSGNPSGGVMDLSGGTADVLADTVYAGRGQTGNGAGASTGTLTFGKGTFDINTLEVGYQNASTAAAVTGTVNVSGGSSSRKSATLVVNTSLRLARYTGSGIVPVGSFNITNGTVQAGTITSGGGTNTISLIGSTLTVTNSSGSIGTIAAPIGTFSIGDSELVLAVRDGFTNVVVTTLTTTSTTKNTASIASLPVIASFPAQYPLVGYSSANSFDFLLGTLPATPSYHGYISNNTAKSSIDLVIGGISRAITWSGASNGDWNLSTTNWLGSGSPTTYNQYDYVLFDDTASGTTTVNLTTTLTPRTLTISNLSHNYTFTGAGSLSGPAGLDKEGAGMLTIGNSGSNGFAGDITIGGGTLQINGSDNRLPPNSAVTLSNVAGAVLDLNNLNQTVGSLAGGGDSGGNVTLGSGTLTLNGGGNFKGILGGSGAIVKNGSDTQKFTGANLYTGGTIVNAGTLAVANVTGSGTGTGSVLVNTNGELRFGNGDPGGSVAAGTITNNGTVTFNRSDDFTLTNVIVGSGSVTKKNTNTVFIPGSNTYTGATTISAGALRISNAGSLGTGSAGTTVQNDQTARLELTGNLTLVAPLTLASKNTSFGNSPTVVNVSGSNTLSGPITATTGGACWTFEVDAGKLAVAGSFTNSATSNQRVVRLRGNALGEWRSSLGNSTSNLSVTALLKEEPGTWVLSGTNTYTGSTTVSNGTLLVTGGILASTNLVVYGGMLGGTGLITAPVTITPGGTLAPGCSIGTLTISNTLALNGTNLMEVSHAAADMVAGLTSVTLGGTLKIVVTGTLTGGESFRLFVATNYSGDFAVYDLPALTSPLSWDTNSVSVDGTLKVVSSQSHPTLEYLHTATNTLVFSWSGAGFHLQSQTNALTVGISTNWHDYPGGATSPVIVPLNTANPAVFYRLVSP